MKIKQESKFGFRDKVFCIESHKEKPTCKVCCGQKTVMMQGRKEGAKLVEVPCPVCDGSGQFSDEYEMIKWHLKSNATLWTIDAVHMHYFKEDKDPDYSYSIKQKFEGGGACFVTADEKNCFKTLNEAKEEMQRRNENPELEYFDID